MVFMQKTRMEMSRINFMGRAEADNKEQTWLQFKGIITITFIHKRTYHRLVLTEPLSK